MLVSGRVSNVHNYDKYTAHNKVHPQMLPVTTKSCFAEDSSLFRGAVGYGTLWRSDITMKFNQIKSTDDHQEYKNDTWWRRLNQCFFWRDARVGKSNKSTFLSFEEHRVWQEIFRYQYISTDICDHPTMLGAVEEKRSLTCISTINSLSGFSTKMIMP